MPQPPKYRISTSTKCTQEGFVEFWDRQYSGYDEEVYQSCMGQPLTAERIRTMFEWKNGRPLSKKKATSILIYSLPTEAIEKDADASSLRAFLGRKGGTIWRIFWAHLQHPGHFPIYDQHVHRAMAYILGWNDLEIPQSNPKKIVAYLDVYLPFHQTFSTFHQRRVDRAL